MNIKEFLGIELPIIQAPMAGVQDSTLAVAVSSAGGLGSLPGAMLSIEKIHTELTAIKSQTDKPYNINFFCHASPVPNAARESRWRTVLKPYFTEYGINAADITRGGGREPFSHEVADVVEGFRPPVVSFHFGLPADDLLERVRGWGSTVLGCATTLEEAQWLETNGADGIIAQGIEAGGHRGMFLSEDLKTQIGMHTLLTQIVEKVKVPVIAAGGIVAARGVKAALNSGSIAAQIGTAYLLCTQTKTSQIHRAAIKSEDARYTAITNLFSGRPARGIVNRAIREIGPINNDAPEFPLASVAITALRKQAEEKGLGDFSPLWCGQNVTGCKEISAAQLTREMAAGV